MFLKAIHVHADGEEVLITVNLDYVISFKPFNSILKNDKRNEKVKTVMQTEEGQFYITADYTRLVNRLGSLKLLTGVIE